MLLLRIFHPPSRPASLISHLHPLSVISGNKSGSPSLFSDLFNRCWLDSTLRSWPYLMAVAVIISASFLKSRRLAVDVIRDLMMCELVCRLAGSFLEQSGRALINTLKGDSDSAWMWILLSPSPCLFLDSLFVSYYFIPHTLPLFNLFSSAQSKEYVSCHKHITFVWADICQEVEDVFVARQPNRKNKC